MQSWVHVLEWRRRTSPHVEAVVDDHGNRWTYEELHRRVEAVAAGLFALVGPTSAVDPDDGPVVAVVAHNNAWFLAIALGAMRAGTIPLLVNWRLSATEIADLLAKADPVAVVSDPACQAVVDAALARRPASDVARVLVPVPGTPQPPGAWTPVASLGGPVPAWPRHRLGHRSTFAILHTSGTTGSAKLIPLANAGHILSLAGFAIDIGDQVASCRHLQLMPLFHLAGFSQAMQCMLTSGTLVVPESFSAAVAVDTIEREDIAFFTAAPSILDMMVADIEGRSNRPDLTSLREIQYGSAPIRPELLRRALRAFGCRFRQIYGNTESQSTVSLLGPEDHQPDNPKLASAGRLALGWEAELVDHEGRPVPCGDPGELVIRGDSLFAGYWRDPAATTAAFLPGGWYRTGDVVRIDDDGYMWVLDRARDMIISGGENVFPAEVEAAMAEHPDVAEAAVVGMPDDRWGEVVHAVVVPTSDDHVGADELIAWTRERLAHFKCPRTVSFAAGLPRTTTGKVLKRALRDRLPGGSTPSPVP